MKFKILREQLLKALNVASRVSPQRSSDPVITYLKIDLTDDGLFFTGTNSIISINYKLPTIIDDTQIIRDTVNGSILVNAFLFTEIIRKIDGEEVSFSQDEDSLVTIKNDKSDFKLNSIRADEFRDIGFDIEGVKISIPSKDFIDMVNQVAFACSSKENNRPQLTAVNVENEGDRITFTATDGARLARKDLSISVNERFNVNIPAKTLQEVIKTITNEKEIEIYLSDKKALFCLDNILFQTTLQIGEYPSTRNIIPRVTHYSLHVDSNEFCNAMERVSLFSSEREFIIKLTMTESAVEVSCKSQQIGSAVEKINNFKYRGERLEISFNNMFVKEAIKSLNSSEVSINFLGEMKPFLIVNLEDNTIIQLVTPVRTY